MGVKFLILYSSSLMKKIMMIGVRSELFMTTTLWVGKHFVGVNCVILRALPYDELACKCGPCGKVN